MTRGYDRSIEPDRHAIGRPLTSHGNSSRFSHNAIQLPFLVALLPIRDDYHSMISSAAHRLKLLRLRIDALDWRTILSLEFGASMYFDIALSLVALYGLLLIHELGHLAAARAVGVRTCRLTLGVGPTLFGFHGPGRLYCAIALLPIGSACVLGDTGPARQHRATRSLAATSIGERAMIYAAGPVFNLGLAALLLSAASWSTGDFSLSWALHADAAAIILIAGTSTLIGLFNLLPIPPLDGGRLALLILEAYRGGPLADSSTARLQRIGSGLIAAASAVLIGSFALRYWRLL